jgi:hypothetical protein
MALKPHSRSLAFEPDHRPPSTKPGNGVAAQTIAMLQRTEQRFERCVESALSATKAQAIILTSNMSVFTFNNF